MQLSRHLRPLAASLALLAMCFGTLPAAAAERTQEANVVAVASLPVTGLEKSPQAVRSDLLLATDGNIYFISSGGGNGGGAIGKLAPDGTVSVHYAFATRDEGAIAYSSLMQGSDGHLYGTTYLGGVDGAGAAFRVTLAGAFTLLHSFGESRTSAALPYTGLVEAPDGNLYGTTLLGGDNNKGTIYRLGLDGSFAIIHHFDGSGGENPEGTLIVGSDGNLYGTTMVGGERNRGVIYRISTAGVYERLYSFPSLGAFGAGGGTNVTGANPRAGLLLAADGNFYGTAYQGGASGHGTVFRMTPAGEVTTVHDFGGPSFGAAYPLAGVSQDAAGNLYGTTERGGTLNLGTAWRIDTTGQFRILHSMTGLKTEGRTPYATLLPVNGVLYGVSIADDEGQGGGAIFKLEQDTGSGFPVAISISQKEITASILPPSTADITWSAPTATTCSKFGAWTGADPIGTSGTLTVTETLAGVYAYGIKCTDAGNVVHNAYVGLVVRTPALQPVDGGGGTGSLSLLMLLLLAALLYRKFVKEIPSQCP